MAMKTLTLEVDESLYPSPLDILKNLPKSKIQIKEQSTDKELSFDKAMNYTLDKNKDLYKRLSCY